MIDFRYSKQEEEFNDLKQSELSNLFTDIHQGFLNKNIQTPRPHQKSSEVKAIYFLYESNPKVGDIEIAASYKLSQLPMLHCYSFAKHDDIRTTETPREVLKFLEELIKDSTGETADEIDYFDDLEDLEDGDLLLEELPNYIRYYPKKTEPLDGNGDSFLNEHQMRFDDIDEDRKRDRIVYSVYREFIDSFK